MSIRVRAIEVGYYGGLLRQPGLGEESEFSINSMQEFSKVWMERIGGAPVAEPSPPNGNGGAPSNTPSEVTVEQLLDAYELIKDEVPDDKKTANGYPNKSFMQEQLGAEISQGVHFAFCKALKERAAPAQPEANT